MQQPQEQSLSSIRARFLFLSHKSLLYSFLAEKVLAEKVPYLHKNVLRSVTAPSEYFALMSSVKRERQSKLLISSLVYYLITSGDPHLLTAKALKLNARLLCVCDARINYSMANARVCISFFSRRKKYSRLRVA